MQESVIPLILDTLADTMCLTRAAVFVFFMTFCVIQARYTGNKIRDLLEDLLDDELSDIDTKDVFHHKRIIDGVAVESSWPWLVVLKIKNENTGDISDNFCGSSLLNSRWLLTAAHCFFGLTEEQANENLNLFEARLGDNDVQATAEETLKNDIAQFLSGIGDLDLEKQEMNELLDWMDWQVGFEKIKIHPEYVYSLELNHPNDIALVKLAKDVPATPDVVSRISAVTLPEQTDEICWPPVGANCTLKGWGCTEANGAVVKELRKTNFTIRSGKKCQQISAIRSSFETRLCAGSMPTEEDELDLYAEFIANNPELAQNITDAGLDEDLLAKVMERVGEKVVWENKGSSACQGDSGGPLMCEKDGEWVQAGIVSWGVMTSTSAAKRFPTVFTRVTHYVDWIHETMSEN